MRAASKPEPDSRHCVVERRNGYWAQVLKPDAVALEAKLSAACLRVVTGDDSPQAMQEMHAAMRDWESYA